jgi:hypothetical protein
MKKELKVEETVEGHDMIQDGWVQGGELGWIDGVVDVEWIDRFMGGS